MHGLDFFYHICKVLWHLDDVFLKPIQDAVPDIEKLRSEPARVLECRSIAIGPRLRYFQSLDLAFAITFFVAISVFHMDGIVFWSFCFVTSLLICFLRRGGRIELSAKGVEMIYRSSEVFCPWALFNAEGRAAIAGNNKEIVLPINRAAILHITADGRAMAFTDEKLAERIESQQICIHSSDFAFMEALYRVKLQELGELLLHLGRALGNSLPDGSPLPKATAWDKKPLEKPRAEIEAGWLKIPVNRLVFPSGCCDCRKATTTRVECRAHVPLLTLGGLVRLGSSGTVLRLR